MITLNKSIPSAQKDRFQCVHGQKCRDNPNNKLEKTSFSKSMPSSDLMKVYFAGIKNESKVTNHHNLISFSGLTANKINTALILGYGSDTSIIKRYDGGYLVDKETNTIVYYGEDAKKFLKHTTHFPFDTQIITQSDGKIIVKSENGEEFKLFEPGAIVINPNTYATVNVLEGNPLVVTTEKKPNWYTNMFPTNEHRAFFETLADKNRYIYKDCINKQAIKDEYTALKSKNIIYDYNDNYVKFSPFYDKESFRQKLNETSLDTKQKAKISRMYNQIHERKKYLIQNTGEVHKSDFSHCPDWVYDKLCSHGILTRDENNSHKAIWDSYYKVDDLQRELWEKVGIYGNVKDDIVRIWEKTTKSGYDITGLVKATDGITEYLHSGKINQHNSKHTEWITNSNEWTKQGAFSTGVSRVISDDATNTRDFNTVRPDEELHKHQNPNNSSEKQTEIYILTQGKAAFCIVNGHSKNIRVFHAGDMCIIPSDLEHGIVAVDGEYEHFCCQSPSTFHYGFKFKNTTEPFSCALTQEAIEKLETTNMQENQKAPV